MFSVPVKMIQFRVKMKYTKTVPRLWNEWVLFERSGHHCASEEWKFLPPRSRAVHLYLEDIFPVC